MDEYLDTRVDRYREFQIILNRDNSRQCGNAFVLQISDDPDETIRPRLEFLGAGSYGTAFSVVDDELTDRNINVVIKLADATHGENRDEIGFGYLASILVETGITPHLPLYTRCKLANDYANPFDTQNCNCNPYVGALGCDFQESDINPMGNEMSFPDWFLPNPPHTHQKRVNYDVRKTDNCLISFAEKLDGSFQSLIELYNDDQDMIDVVCSLLGQTIFGLKAMRDYTGAGSWIHRDLHPENILFISS